MTDIADTARAHYNVAGLTAKIREALLTIAPDDQQLTIADIATMDQFHTRGMLATRDLAAMTKIGPETRVLDLGCGIGGPSRFLASTFGCHVTGLDLSETFIDAARYLTDRCAMQDLVSFQVGNALDLPYAAGTFDLVFLQHVVMNIEDRARLYAGIVRVLAPAGRLATYDVILKGGDVRYPTPWARDVAASFLLTEDETRDALVSSGLDPLAWRDDSAVALDWFAMLAAGGPPAGPTLAVVLGPDVPVLVWWSPSGLQTEALQYPRHARLTCLNAAARWSIWCVPGAIPPISSASSNRRRSRSVTGSRRRTGRRASDRDARVPGGERWQPCRARARRALQSGGVRTRSCDWSATSSLEPRPGSRAIEP